MPSREQLIQCTQSIVSMAIAEDFGLGEADSGDITTEALISPEILGEAIILAKERLVVCGNEVAIEVCKQVDERLQYQILIGDGETAENGQYIARIIGPFSGILKAERTLLNFMQRLSGVASATAQVVRALEGTGVKVLDTRKTTPGLRLLEKYAVKLGGGENHRFGLYDQVLIKNNHIDAIGGDVAEAIRRCRDSVREGVKIEVEVRNESELRQALSEVPDAILLDNMKLEELRSSVKIVKSMASGKEIELEASGGIDLSKARAIAETGVTSLSMGSLTHTVRAADISLRWVGPQKKIS